MQNESDDSDLDRIEIIPSSIRVFHVTSELENFAIEFEPGYLLLYSDYREGARKYIARLPSERKEILRRELQEFVSAHQDKSLDELKTSWFKAGAMEWPRNQNVRELFQDFLQILSE